MLRLLALAGKRLSSVRIALALAALAISSHAQTYTVLHDFTGSQDGGMPMAGVTMDRSGSLLGTANYGGNFGGSCGSSGCGLVYKLTNRSGSWILSPLYTFQGGNDGANPQVANVTIAPDGTLVSTTYYGGAGCDNPNGCGTVFKLQPRASACATVVCPWNETILHRFTGTDGSGPVGAVYIDVDGNVYGATNTGGFQNGGTVYQLNASDNYQLGVLARVYGYPGSSVAPNHAGDLFGSTFIGLQSPGTIYKLTQSGSNWINTTLYEFTNGADGGYPQSGLILDAAGNLYGATSSGGSGNGGTVFQLVPSGGGYSFNLLYSFAGPNNGRQVVGPIGNLVMDQAGNLYGTTLVDGIHAFGAVFKLTNSNGNWTYTSLHDFTGGSDGAYPYSTLVLDAAGNIYGTASAGGAFGAGVVFQLMP